jgi:hypothetical protein
VIVAPAASFYDVILGVHVMAVVVAFGVTFAYPIMFAVGARHGARSLPLLHRIEYTIERFLVNPGLVVVLAAGIFLASDGHHWSELFVQWGLAAVIASEHGDPQMSEEYQGLVRRLSIVGSLLSVIVLITILFMAIKP